MILGQNAVLPLLVDQVVQIGVKHRKIGQLVFRDLGPVVGLVEMQGQDAVLDGKGGDLLVFKELQHLGVLLHLGQTGRLEQGGYGGEEDDQHQGVN